MGAPGIREEIKAVLVLQRFSANWRPPNKVLSPGAIILESSILQREPRIIQSLCLKGPHSCVVNPAALRLVSLFYFHFPCILTYADITLTYFYYV